MAFFDMFKCVDQYGSNEPSPTSVPENPQPVSGWEGMYNTLKMEPTYYRVNSYMLPYTSSHWESGSPMLRTMNDETFIPPFSEKIDPNKIFNSDINALRALAADQAKILKVFEKKALESLTDKNKFGVTEEDVESMQAITAARNAIVAINEKQINVKKHIAELKIKQQATVGIGGSGASQANSGPTQYGTEVLDSIFAANAQPMATMPPAEYTPTSVEQASDLLDSLVNVNPNIINEKNNINTVVVVGDTTNDVTFEQYDALGNKVENPVELPNVKIDTLDIQAKQAVDELGRPYTVVKRGDEEM